MAITHEFIPCQRIADSKYGVYDTVAEVFLPQALGTPGQETTGHNLPVEYKELEYITFRGYDDGCWSVYDYFYLSNTDIVTVDFDFYVNLMPSTSWGTIFGARGDNLDNPQNDCFYVQIRSETGENVDNIRWGYEANETDYPVTTPTGRHTITIRNDAFYFDNVELGHFGGIVPFTTYRPIGIGILNDCGTWSTGSGAEIKLYSMTVDDGINSTLFYYDTNAVSDFYYNGNQVTSLIYDGNTVY